MPKVTVIIPSYNHAKFIGEAIQSVLDQTFQDFEVLIRDDGSKDNSIAVIKQFTDSRIKFTANPHNMGACYTVNTMIEEANGEYIALLNSDDVWMLDKLEKQVKFLDENPQYAAVFANAFMINEEGSYLENIAGLYHCISDSNFTRIDWLKKFYTIENSIFHPTMLIRRYIYIRIGLYNNLLFLTPDFEMWVRLFSKYNIFVLPNKLIKFRVLNDGKNASGSTSANILRMNFEATKIYDAFCLIDSVETFNQVFPNSIVSDARQIPFSIAKNLLEDRKPYAISWAINKLYQLLNDDYNYYSQFMTDVEFTKLAASKDIYDVFGARGAVVHLFYDNGQDFNGEQYLQQDIVIGKNGYSFNLSDLSGITRLRLDPINQPAKVKLLSAYAILDNDENYPLELVWHNADLNADVYDFKHDDPQMIFNIPEAIQVILISVEFVVDITPYNKWEILQLLESSRNESYTISQQLAITQQQLQQAEQQVYQLNPWSHSVVALHYDIGQGFNAEHYLQQSAQSGLNHYEFSLSDITCIQGVRLDPLNLPAKVKLLSAYAKLDNNENYQLELVLHNADLNADVYDFKHDDPQMVFNIPVDIQARLVSVEFVVDITPYNKWEILQLLESSRNESYTISQQLAITQQQLQQAEQQAHQLNPWSHSVVVVHYDIGQNFNAEHYLQQSAQAGLNHYEFNLSETVGIRGVRLDPLNLPAHIKLISAQVLAKDGSFYPLSVVWHNANQINGNCYSFYHDDPIWIFDWMEFSTLDYDKIMFEFELELIEVRELSNFVVHQLALLNIKEAELSSTQSELISTQAELSSTQAELISTQSELISTQSELISTQSELISTQSELISTQSELSGVYNSRSWKITQPLRKIKRK